MTSILITGIIIAIIGASIATTYETLSNNVIYVKSNVDGNKYLVQNRPDKQEACDLLARVRQKLERFVNHLTVKYPDREDIRRLHKKFRPNNIVEKPDDGNYTSYSVNKGEKIVICLRAKNDQQKLVDENIITFVGLHEISHIMTTSIGHKPDFWGNFKFILKEAIDNGTYKYVDFNSSPQPYCGIKITDTPYKM